MRRLARPGLMYSEFNVSLDYPPVPIVAVFGKREEFWVPGSLQVDN
jgi:hypothetical protein